MVSFSQVSSEPAFEIAWKNELETSLNGPEFPEKGPLWRLKVLSTSGDHEKVAMAFTMNHGLDDQQSLNILMRDILTFYNYLRLADNTSTLEGGLEPCMFPKSMEQAVCPQPPGLATADWSIFQLGTSVDISTPPYHPFIIYIEAISRLYSLM